jgi:hypothetical protein
VNLRNLRRICLLAGWCLGVLAFIGGGRLAAADVEQWDVWETMLKGPSEGNPYVDVQLSATFRQDGEGITAPGFYDGDGTYKFRFSPPKPGAWKYETKSNRPELDGKSGTFNAVKPTGDNHGPVEVYKTFYFRHADGTSYHQYGTTCYAWVHQTQELQEQTLKTLATAPFNKIRFCVFPKDYAYNKNEPELFAFQKGGAGKKFDFSRPDPVFWRHLEKRVLELQKLGIEADIILWHPYDRWGFARMGDEADDRYLRYCIARLAAYRNVWGSLANEFQILGKPMSTWDRFFSILQKEDPYNRMRGIHNLSLMYDHTKPWVTHASLQKWDTENGMKYREQYSKPVIFDEGGYEGNIGQIFGRLSGRDMTRRFWLGTCTGTYVGHGECYRDPKDVLWWSKGGVLKGESPKRIAWLKEFMSKAPAFDELKPLGDLVVAKEGEYYLAYFRSAQAKTIELGGTRPYKVELIDTWEMTVSPVGTASPGKFTFAAPKADQAYRFTLYPPGETVLPEAKK